MARAQGDARKQIEAKISEAMTAYDEFDYEKARTLLNQALLKSKTAKLGNDKVTAKVHLALGIIYMAGFQDKDSAKVYFLDAVAIDAKVQIDPAYKTAELEKLLDEARKDAGVDKGGGDKGGGDKGQPKGGGDKGGGDKGGGDKGGGDKGGGDKGGGDKGGGDKGGGDPPEVAVADDVDCVSLVGIDHDLIDEAQPGKPKSIVAHIADALDAAKVALHYRAKGASSFQEVRMSRASGCRFEATIPKKVFSGEFVHYYVAVYDKGGKVLASKGSSGSPNIIEVAGMAIGDDDDDDGGENPLGPDGGITKPGVTAPKPAKVFISFAAGSGGGYVSGNTEQLESPVGCCFAPALLHLFPEIGFFISPKTSISAAFRLGFPIGANRDGHAGPAAAGLLRVRHAIAPSGEGVVVNGSVGAGIIRHTVKLTGIADPAEGDTDTSASGPLFLGTGAGYMRGLGGPMRFIAELNVLAGIPVASLGEIDPGFALQIDANLGLVVAF